MSTKVKKSTKVQTAKAAACGKLTRPTSDSRKKIKVIRALVEEIAAKLGMP